MNTIRVVLRIVFLCCLTLVSLNPLHVQDRKGAITGDVTDSSHQHPQRHSTNPQPKTVTHNFIDNTYLISYNEPLRFTIMGKGCRPKNSTRVRAKICKTMSSKGLLRCTKFRLSTLELATSKNKCVLRGVGGIQPYSIAFPIWESRIQTIPNLQLPSQIS
jgi:hypothetical protein